MHIFYAHLMHIYAQPYKLTPYPLKFFRYDVPGGYLGDLPGIGCSLISTGDTIIQIKFGSPNAKNYESDVYLFEA